MGPVCQSAGGGCQDTLTLDPLTDKETFWGGAVVARKWMKCDGIRDNEKGIVNTFTYRENVAMSTAEITKIDNSHNS